MLHVKESVVPSRFYRKSVYIFILLKILASVWSNATITVWSII